MRAIAEHLVVIAFIVAFSYGFGFMNCVMIFSAEMCWGELVSYVP